MTGRHDDPAPQHDPAALRTATKKAQGDASDPAASAWVSANAGAGKTHVLKQRVLRILLSGTPPARILCLTYTRAAAAEMQTRVFKDLSMWATTSAEVLEHELRENVLGRPPRPEEMADARNLFARAIETPGGLKVQTIHAFCERLLQRFPLEAGVPAGFSILDDTEGAGLRREATDAVLSQAARDRQSPLGQALACMIAFADGAGFDDVLTSALSKRDWLASMRLTIDASDGDDAAESVYRRALGIRSRGSRAEIEHEMAAVMSDADMRRAAGALSEGGKNDAKLADALNAAARASDEQARLAALQDVFLTKQMEPRSDRNFVSKPIQNSHPDVHERMLCARDRFHELWQERQGLIVVQASLALLVIADAVMQRYTEAKARRAALDFDDLVTRTANLLGLSDAAQWVLYKLDGGLDHILVDEAQDTSPVQWSVVRMLASEFFAGSGAREQARTIFAVGDEKQSIYSFQGAAPRMFAETGIDFQKLARSGRQTWRTVPLTLSFRTVKPLLDAVDCVFADPARTPGVSSGTVKHVAHRLGQAGGIEIWDTEKPDDVEAADAWLPLEEKSPSSPVSRLAARIADTIADWLGSGAMLKSQNRAVRPGDILILVRRRNPFAAPMVASLKARGIPVAGADRLLLTEQIAVKDLVSLGDFLTLPENDLALAEVLKSPLIGLDDDDLMSFAPARKGALWSALIEAARSNPPLQPAAETLRRWRSGADQLPPFEFYAELLDRDGGRGRLIARLGAEAADAITEFLDLALAFDEVEPPSLTGFLQWLRNGTRQIKRDMEHGRDEVRVLTVHGAKGLEAPIVFMADTCSISSGRRPGELIELNGTGSAPGAPSALAWPVKGSSRLLGISAGRRALQAADAEERDRLLYVAMTRARDHLVVAGFEGRRGRDAGCWYELISQALTDRLETAHDRAGRSIRRLVCAQTAEPETARHAGHLAPGPLPPPDWANQPAPREPHLVIPVAPSRLAPYDIDETGEPTPTRSDAAARDREPDFPSPLRLAGDHRFLRGTLTHALLEHLPSLDPKGWEAAARGFVEARGQALPPGARASIVAETLAVLRNPRFAAVFGPEAQSEVPVVAVIEPPSGKGPELRLNGQIDRLVVGSREILIVDYKTNRPPPSTAEGVAVAYLTQLAAYRLALARIYPAHGIRAAILWTDGARLMEIPSELLDRHASMLWQLADRSLDAGVRGS